MNRLIAILIAPMVLPLASADELTAVRHASGVTSPQILSFANVRLRNQSAEAWDMFSKARSLADRGMLNNAAETYSALIAAFPGLAEAHNNLGVLQIQLGQYEKAEATFMNAIRLRPDYAIAHENLGDVHVRMALHSYDAAVRLSPEDPAVAEKKQRLLSVMKVRGGRASSGLSPPVTNLQSH